MRVAGAGCLVLGDRGDVRARFTFLIGLFVGLAAVRARARHVKIIFGTNADLVAVAGNPLEDITAVRRAVFVMKGGRVFKHVAR